MQGKVCAITGANAGLGFESAKALAQMGAEILMICRSESRGAAARQQLIAETGNSKIHLIIADLSDQQAVRAAAQQIADQWTVLDVLINNSAAILSEHTLSTDGIEMQFAVNHLGHFLLTHCVLPLLQKAPEARVVNISSGNHSRGKIYFEDVNLTNNYQVLRAYNQTKLANVFFTYELDRRCREKGLHTITSNVVDPGTNMTKIGNKGTNFFHSLAWKVRVLISSQKPADGAKTQVFVASSPELDGISGKFWYQSKAVSSAKITYDLPMADRLWALSKEMCAIKNFFEA